MKKIALLMAVLMLLFSVAACGQEKNDSVNTTQTPAGENGETEGITQAAVVLCEHQYEETVLLDPTCEEDGICELKCIECGETVTEAIPAVGHRGTGASCEEPSFCIVCGMVDELAWGHEEFYGYCTRCGVDMGNASAGSDEPAQTEPATEVTEPVETEPEVTEPETTEPEVTEPAETEAEVTESAQTEAEVTESAQTEE